MKGTYYEFYFYRDMYCKLMQDLLLNTSQVKKYRLPLFPFPINSGSKCSVPKAVIRTKFSLVSRRHLSWPMASIAMSEIGVLCQTPEK
jgi:hypothetical protein